jgi:DNA-binding NarL/FixJ family response regulator
MIRVLLVDDHAVLRDGLKALLSAAPDICVIGEASDGRQAIRCTTELNPDIVVMDISMPGLNGIEAVRALHERLSIARVVILSMHSAAEHVHRALDAGAHGYVLKEAAGAEVLTAVRSVHQGRRYVSRALARCMAEVEISDTRSSALDRLSAREREVLQLVVEGQSSREIAARMHLSPKTVETYRSRVMTKLCVSGITELVRFALRHGITSLD